MARKRKSRLSRITRRFTVIRHFRSKKTGQWFAIFPSKPGRPGGARFSGKPKGNWYDRLGRLHDGDTGRIRRKTPAPPKPPTEYQGLRRIAGHLARVTGVPWFIEREPVKWIGWQSQWLLAPDDDEQFEWFAMAEAFARVNADRKIAEALGGPLRIGHMGFVLDDSIEDTHGENAGNPKPYFLPLEAQMDVPSMLAEAPSILSRHGGRYREEAVRGVSLKFRHYEKRERKRRRKKKRK